MADLRTMRRELIGAFALLFAGALLVAAAGILIVMPRLSPTAAAAYVVLLIVADLLVFHWAASRLLRRRLFEPLDELVAAVEAVSGGKYDQPLPAHDTLELRRLSMAVDAMAKRLLQDQQTLADNIRSLNETNRLLTDARDAMIRQEKLASVGRLGAGIAHEVGNPLGAILGYIALAQRKPGPECRELLQCAEREAQRIDRIVRGLLDFARPREAVAQPLDVRDVVVDTLDLVRTQGHFAGLSLESGDLVDVHGLIVRGDRHQLQQVFVNLLVNAANAVEETPDPRVRVQALRRPAVSPPEHRPARRRDDPAGVDYSHRRRLAVTPRWPVGDPESESGEVVEILIADNGPGLAPQMIDQIFEPFVTTKEPGKGTGLGLALCARLVEGMGGVIRAGNAPEGGARFRVVLPAVPAEVKST